MEVIHQSIIILILIDLCKGLDEESLERLLLHQSWFVIILFGFSFEYTWHISLKLVYSCMCLSTITSILVDEFVSSNQLV
jgi:hypothetical protein